MRLCADLRTTRTDRWNPVEDRWSGARLARNWDAAGGWRAARAALVALVRDFLEPFRIGGWLSKALGKDSSMTRLGFRAGR